MIGKKLYIGEFIDEEYTAVADWCNTNEAYISDEHAFDKTRPYYEVKLWRTAEEKERDEIESQIFLLKDYLEKTDWVTAKMIEVSDASDELAALRVKYADILSERKSTREKINELEEKLSALSN